MMEKKRKFHMEGLLVLVLLGVFALCILGVLLLGADAYQRLTERGQAASDSRTAAQYIATRVRQGDVSRAVTLEQLGAAEALVLTEDMEGRTCRTWVYCYDGWLRELFGEAGSGFLPEDGEKILEAESVDWSWEADCLRADITVEAQTEVVILTLRSGEEAVP